MISIKNNIQTTKGQVLFGFCIWIVLIVLYLPASNALLIDDGINGLYDLKSQGWSGLVNSYGFDSFYHGYYLLLQIVYQIFGLNSICWLLLFSGLHALNTVVLFTFLRKLLSLSSVKNSEFVASFSALFFAFTPLNAELIIWAATLHYIIALAVLLFTLSQLISIFTGERKNILLLICINLFAFFTFELSLFFPLIYLLLYIFIRSIGINNYPTKAFTYKILLPLCLLVLGYFTALFYTKQTILPHGVATFDLAAQSGDIIRNYFRYLAKIFGFVHYMDFENRDLIYSKWCSHYKKILLAFTFLGAIATYWMYRKSATKAKLFVLFWIVGSILLLPFCARYFVIVAQYENLRYCYFGLVFFYAALHIFLSNFNLKIHSIMTTLFLLFCIVLIYHTVKDKRESGKVYSSFIQNFPNDTSKTIYLLNTPSFQNGSYMFWDNSRLPIALNIFKNWNPQDHKIVQVYHYFGQTKNDQFESKKVNDSTFQFRVISPGCWLMSESNGAVNYETTAFSCMVGQWGDFRLSFKRKLFTNEILFYFQDGKFIEMR